MDWLTYLKRKKIKNKINKNDSKLKQILKIQTIYYLAWKNINGTIVLKYKLAIE